MTLGQLVPGFCNQFLVHCASYQLGAARSFPTGRAQTHAGQRVAQEHQLTATQNTHFLLSGDLSFINIIGLETQW